MVILSTIRLLGRPVQLALHLTIAVGERRPQHEFYPTQEKNLSEGTRFVEPLATGEAPFVYSDRWSRAAVMSLTFWTRRLALSGTGLNP